MNIEQATAAVTKAAAELEAVKAEYGASLAEGKASAALKSKVEKAEAAHEEAQLIAKAIAAAEEKAARDAAAKAEKDAAKALEARWKQAEADANDLVATAAGVDRTLAKLKELLERMDHQGRHLVANHRDLGINPNAVSAISAQSWCGQVLQLLKSDMGRGMRMTLDKTITFGVPGKTIASSVPSFDRIFPKAPKLSLEKKDAA